MHETDEDLKALFELLKESHQEIHLNCSDPEEVRKFEILFQLLHQRHDRLLKGAKLLLDKEPTEL